MRTAPVAADAVQEQDPNDLTEEQGMDNTETNAARAALDALRCKGWTKGVMRDEDGAQCVANAVIWTTPNAVANNRAYDATCAVIGEQFPERSERLWEPGSFSIALFNDHEDTTFADVELVLEKAAVKLDEAVQ